MSSVNRVLEKRRKAHSGSSQPIETTSSETDSISHISTGPAQVPSLPSSPKNASPSIQNAKPSIKNTQSMRSTTLPPSNFPTSMRQGRSPSTIDTAHQ